MEPMADPIADVCLILEGSYPYTKGGVSEWTHQLVTGLPDLTFHLWCIIPPRADEKPLYELPRNVVGWSNVHLFEEVKESRLELEESRVWDTVRRFHRRGQNVEERAQVLWGELKDVMPMGEADRGLDPLLFSSQTFERLTELYDARSSSLSFIDYFYTYLYSHIPIFRLMGVKVPPARIYHTISTGYAGFLGCKARRDTGGSLILTEHGIYTNERQIDIILANWIYTEADTGIRIGPQTDNLKHVWIEMFNFLGQLTYHEADWITTLSQQNRDMQVLLGAPPDKMEIIPNGVAVSKFADLGRQKGKSGPLIGLVGRVVPIKDVRTFVKACRTVADRIPDARFLVMGPTDADPGYYENCLEYRRLLGLEDRLVFTGNVKVTEYYPQLDAVVLTSVSEGLPLTVLEAMACGIPVVCTRVGACEELVVGRSREDREIGRSGYITDVGDHRAVGEAITKILESRDLAEQFGRAGQQRVREHYDLNRIIARYAKLYQDWLGRRRQK